MQNGFIEPSSVGCSPALTGLIERTAGVPGLHRADHVMKDLVNLYSGSVPALYDRYRGPVFFEPYARDLAGRLLKSKKLS